MKNVHEFIPWNATDSRAVAEQIRGHVKYHEEQGTQVGIVVCLVTKHELGNVYSPYCSDLPPEMLLMAAERIRRLAMRYLDDPKP